MAEYIRKEGIVDATKITNVDTADGETGKSTLNEGDYVVKGRHRWDTEPRIVSKKDFESEYTRINKGKTEEPPKPPTMQEIASKKMNDIGMR